MKKASEEVMAAAEAALAEAQAEYERREAYFKMPKEQLYQMAEGGDDLAAAFYVRQRLEDDEMTPSDVELLERALYNLTPEAAMLGEIIFGTDGSIYEDRDKTLFCYVVEEADDDKDAHKKLLKAVKRESAAVARAQDKLILSVLISYSAASGASRMRITLRRADKDECEFKDGYVLELTVKRGDRAETQPVIAVYNLEGKKENVFTGEIFKRLKRLAEDNRLLGADCLEIETEGQSVVLGGVQGQQLAAGTLKENPAAEREPRKVEDVNLNVRVTDKKVLSAAVCPACGKAMNSKGGGYVCPSCGYQSDDGAAKASGDEIVIEQGGDMTALKCEFCGGEVKADGAGGGVCRHCGTTYIINDGGVCSGVRGIDVDNLKAAKPEGEPLPQVEFVRAELLGGDLSSVIPSDFSVMSADLARIKYPRNAPEFIYTSRDTTVNLCFTVKRETALREEDVIRAGGGALAALQGVQKQAVFGTGRQFQAEGKNIYFFDFVTPALDQPIYNAMFFFSLNGSYAMGSWNCLAKDRWFYAPVFELAVRTMKF